MADRMRASDAEREETVALLRHAVGEGRLDTEEFTDRTTRAYLAKTRGELLELIDDIPRAQPAPVRRRASSPRRPGRAGFSARWLAPARRRQASAELLEFVAPPMRSHGYALEATQANLVFAASAARRGRSCSPSLLFPVGLIGAAAHRARRDRVRAARARRGDDDRRERPGAARDQARAERTRALTISHAGGNHAVNSSRGRGRSTPRARRGHEPPLDDLVRVRHRVAGDLVTNRWSSSFSTRSRISAR